MGAPGFALADTLKVRVEDAGGSPRQGVTVTWQVRAGGGSIAPIADTTDANGVAAAIWTLGGTPGPNELRASSSDESSVTFRATGDVFRVDRLASDWRLACGLVSGDLWCWGRYFWANSAPASIYAPHWDNFSPGLVDDTHDFVDLAVSARFVCALDQVGAVWCASATDPQVAQVAGLPPIRGLVGRGWGPSRFCGLAVADSTAWCWWTGTGTTVAPAQVPGSPAFVRLWSDFSTSCGLLADSTAACWGAGPLGNGSEDSSSTPVAVNGGHKFVELGVGSWVSCGRTPTFEAWCWGRRFAGALPLILEPARVASNASVLGVESYYIMVLGAATGLTRGTFADFFPAPATGLSGVPVDRFANNGVSCVQSAGGGVHCTEEMWNGWTGVYYEIYHPVPPVRSLPLTVLRQ